MDARLLEQGWGAVRKRWPSARPKCGMVLGSGWAAVADSLQLRDSIAYNDIPGLGAATVAGHKGRLVWGDLNGVETFVFQGRRHYYEGDGWTPVALPVFILRQAGAAMLALTNASGGIAAQSVPGSFMLITDHINLMGANPLVGAHNPIWGTRFPDMTSIYDTELRRVFREAARRHNCELSEGVYVAVSGPSFETPAEIRAFAGLGAHAVGMSTAPEAILANAAGLRVLGVSCIANRAAGFAGRPLTHEEIGDVMARAAGVILPVITDVWPKLARL